MNLFGQSDASFRSWKDDKARRNRGEFTSFREASRQVQYASPAFQSKSGKKGTTYDWERDLVADLPKSYGKSYDEKLRNALLVSGVPEGEQDAFRKFMDAKEKKKLASSVLDKSFEMANARAKFPTPKTPTFSKKEKPHIKNDRSILDRAFDQLLYLNYASAGFADGFRKQLQGESNDPWIAWKQAWQGLEAGSMFNDGNEEGERTFSDVLDNAGWKPESWYGKLAKGTAGFALDVALDPSTYVSLGTSNLIKGSGQVGKTAGKLLGTGEIKAMDVEQAKTIVQKHASSKGKPLTPDEVTRDAERLVKKYNDIRGVGRSVENGKIGVGKLSKEFSGDTLQKIGDATLAPAYQKLRDAVYGSWVGKKFSTKHGLYNLAKNNPAEFFATIKALDKKQGLDMLKHQDEKNIRETAKALGLELSPHEEKLLREVMEDKRFWAPIKEKIRLSQTKEAQSFAEKLFQRKELHVAKLNQLRQDKEDLERLAFGEEAKLIDKQIEKDALQKELDKQIADLDIQYFEQGKDYEEAVNLLRSKSEELEKDFAGYSVPLHAPKLDLPTEPVMPKRKYAKKPKEPQYVDVPDLPELPPHVEKGDIPLNGEAHTIASKIDTVKEMKSTDPARKQVIDEMSQLIYGETGHISPLTWTAQLEELATLIKDGHSVKTLREHIEKKKHFYDGRQTDIYNYMGEKYGYGKDHPKFKSWEEFYTKPMQELNAQIENGIPLTNAQKKKMAKLEKARVNRAMDLARLKNMNPAQIMNDKQKWLDTELEREFKKIENSSVNAGSESWYVDDDGIMRKSIRDKDAKKSFDDMEEERRQKFNADDSSVDAGTKKTYRASKNAETGEMETVSESTRTGKSLDENFRLYGDTYDDVMGEILHSIGKEGEAPRPSEVEYAKAVADRVPNVIERTFGRKWDDLNPNEQELAIYLAHKEMRSGSGKEAIKEGQERINALLQIKHEREKAKAIERVASPGKGIIFKDKKGVLWKGKIFNVAIDEDNLGTIYNVIDNEGKLVQIKANQITRVDKQTPQQIVLENASQNMMDKEYAESVAKREEEIKRIEDAHKAEVDKANDANRELMMEYEQKLADYEAEKVAKREEYEAKKQAYTNEHAKWLSDVEEAKALHEASVEDWKNAIRESSIIAKDYLNKRDELRMELEEALGRFAMNDTRKEVRVRQIMSEYMEKEQKVVREITDLERSKALYDDTIESGAFDEIDTLEEQIAKAEQALTDADALEILMRESMDSGKMQSIVDGAPTIDTGRIMMDDSLDVPEKINRIAKMLRQTFMDVAEKEVGIQKLSQEQADAMMMRYLPHVLNPVVERMLKSKSFIKKNGSQLTKDFGFGQKWNPFAQSRNLDGTIDEINPKFRDILKGNNLFQENVAEIYLTRMLSHNEVMYDDALMKTMLDDFGHKWTPDTITQPGFKTVFNFGMFKRTASDMSRLHVSMDISDDVARYVASLGLPPGVNAKPYIEEYMKNTYTDDVMSEMFNRYYGGFIEQLGVKEENFYQLATPMLELSEEQAQRIHGFYHSTTNEFSERLAKRRSNVMKYGDADDYDRLAKMEETFNKVVPLQIANVNDVLVQKTNQVRKLQIAKDQSKVLRLFDKFQHLIKLNQTTVMPAFHARNMMANSFLNWLAVGQDAVNPRMHAVTKLVAHHQGDTVKLNELMQNPKYKKLLTPIVDPNGKVYHWDEIYDLAKQYGGIDEGFFAKDVGAEASTSGLFGGKFDPTDSENFALYRLGGAMGNKIENSDRLLHIASMLKQGKTMEEAVESSKKFLFDYSDLTAFEQSVMKRIFPYYTWLRKNGRLQMSQLLEQPDKYRDVAKAMNMIEGGVAQEDQVERPYMSDFAKDWKQTIFNYKTKDGNVEPILWNPNLPFMDLTRIPDPTRPVDSLVNLFTQTTPIGKVPIEQALNKNFFFDDRIVDRKDGMKTAIAKRLMHAGSQNALFTAGEGFASKDGIDLALHAGNALTGQKFLSYDYDTSKKMAIAKALGQMDKDKLPIDHVIDKANEMEDKVTTLPTQAENAIREKVNTERNHIATITDKFLQGTLTEKQMGKYKPVINMVQSVAEKFGVDEVKQRTFTSAFLDSTSLDGLVLNKDFETGKVVDVMDGDTFKVRINGKEQKIRMLLVDTPETVDPRVKMPMPFGKEASNFTKKELSDQDIRLVIDRTQQDAHGRVLAYVYHKGEDYNRKLLTEGLGKVRYVNNSNDKERINDYFQAQQDTAQRQTGIWGVSGYADAYTDSGYDMQVAKKRYLDMLAKRGN